MLKEAVASSKPVLFLYPSDSFNPRAVDETYEYEWQAARQAGIETALFDFDRFQSGETIRPRAFTPNQKVIYRGWMMQAEQYERYLQWVVKAGGVPVTSLKAYLLCHHLPRWYPLLRDFTAETLFFDEQDDVAAALRTQGWTGCFLKDHVKSLSTGQGSLLNDLDQISACVSQMRKFRSFIEGGLCARKIEAYIAGTERRFFVIQGQPYGDETEIPDCIQAAASLIESPFFSVDVAMRKDGVMRIIELGDGQVSDRKHWAAEELVCDLRSGFNLKA